MTSQPSHTQPWPRHDPVPLDELARRRGIRPVTAVEDMAEDGIFATDDEVEEFLTYTARHADLG